MTLTAAELREILSYDPETGVFTWARSPNRKIRVGDVAGSIKRGSRGSECTVIVFRRRVYTAHRLAWLYTYGVWPVELIDHANGNPHDNRIANLRIATASQNMANTKFRRHNTSGVRGVLWRGDVRKWQALIQVNKKRKHLGYFEDKNEAAAAYQRAYKQFFGEFVASR
jgi:hypothetical protein